MKKVLPSITTLEDIKREKRLLRRKIKEHDVVLQESAGKLPGYIFRSSVSKIGKGYAIIKIAKALAPWAIGMMVPKKQTSFLAGMATDALFSKEGGIFSRIKGLFSKKK